MSERNAMAGVKISAAREAAAQSRPPTMADVARLADVSTATVSNVLSGRPNLLRRVGAEAQERVAVRELNYIHNNVARHLRLRRTKRLCVVLPRLGIPFADKMAQDIQNVAQRRGFATIVTTASTVDGFRHILREIESGLADGMIADLESMIADDANKVLRALERTSKPSLVIHADGEITGPFSVMMHQRVPALRKVLAHAVASGHRLIAYVNNNGSDTNPRVAEVKDFAAATPEMSPPLVFDRVNERKTAAERARAIAALVPRPTMVIVESDYTAVAMLEEFQRLGLEVPRDIGLVGCGNAEEGYYCTPRLSTIGPTALSMTAATEHIIESIIDNSNAPPRQFVVPWTLYLRESG